MIRVTECTVSIRETVLPSSDCVWRNEFSL